jgi:hypothetical protein
MTLENMLRKSLAEPNPYSYTEGPPPDGFTHHGWHVKLRKEATEALSCVLWDVTLQCEGAAPAADVRAWAERVGRTVTGLLEPLKLLEVDAPQQIALLRSVAPTPRDPGLHYYELELRGAGKATLRRFQGFHEVGRPREQIPFTVTFEALAKLIDDVTADK